MRISLTHGIHTSNVRYYYLQTIGHLPETEKISEIRQTAWKNVYRIDIELRIFTTHANIAFLNLRLEYLSLLFVAYFSYKHQLMNYEFLLITFFHAFEDFVWKTRWRYWLNYSSNKNMWQRIRRYIKRRLNLERIISFASFQDDQNISMKGRF